MDEKSPIKYIINETKYGTSTLSTTKYNERQMSREWLFGEKSGNNRLKNAAEKYKFSYKELINAFNRNEVKLILSKVDESGKVTLYELDTTGKILGEWP